MMPLTINTDDQQELTSKPAHTGRDGYNHYRREFIRLFRETARYHHRHEVFRDLVEMGALAVQNAFLRSAKLEKEYRDIAKRYQPDDQVRIKRLLDCFTDALDCKHGDFLGEIFMELEIGSAHMGQYFTPYHLSRMMAHLTAGDIGKELEHKRFITLQDPAAGAGGLVIAYAELMAEQGINYQEKLFAVCVDIDPVAAHMCYLQLSYLGVPAEVVIGNTLTLEMRRTFRTPLWYVGNWHERLATENAIEVLRNFLKG